MATLSDYVSGTLTLTNGSANFTGTGTGWLSAGFREGDVIFDVPGATAFMGVIETITGEGTGTLTHPWEGPTLAGVAYRMRFMSDGSRMTAAARQLIEHLGNGNIQALAGLIGASGKIPMFNGPGSMELLSRQDLISGAAYDVQVDDLAARAAYDGQDAGYTVLVSDTGDGRAAIYSKNSATSGDWSDPAYVTGPAITLDITEVDEVPYGTPPDATLTPKVGGYDLTFDIPRGMMIEPGTTTTLASDQPAAVTFVPITGGYRLDIAIPRGPTGDITGVTPFWVTRLGLDADATAARIGLDAVGAPATAGDNRVAVFDGDGKLIKDGGKTIAELVPAGYDDLQFTVSQLALVAADNANITLFLGPNGNRVADSFETLTYVDVAGATNLDTSAAGILKPSAPQTQVGQAVGTVIGDMTTLGGAAAAFDGVTAQAYTASARSAPGTPRGFVGKDWGAGNTRRLTGFRIYSPSNVVGFETTGSNVRVTLKGSNSPPTAWDGDGFGGTNLYRNSSVPAPAGSNTAFAGLTGITDNNFRYHWVEVVYLGGASEVYVAEAQFFESPVQNMTVRSASFTAAAVPTKMKALINVRELEAAAAGTDYTLECSRDGGTTWAAMPLTERYTAGNLRVVEAAETSVDGQPSGTAPRWRFKTLNNKNVELHDVYLYWS